MIVISFISGSMPPKKDKKKGQGIGPKEVDADAYVREVCCLHS